MKRITIKDILRKKGKIEADDFKKVGYKKIDITGHKPPVKKKW